MDNRQTDRQEDRQEDRQTGRKTDRQAQAGMQGNNYMYLNDIEEQYIILNDFDGIHLGFLKLFFFIIMHGIAIMSETEEGLQKGLLLFEEFCGRWKLTVNCLEQWRSIYLQTKYNLYKGEALEIVTKLTYLGIVFTVGGSFNVTFKKSVQSLKASFKL